LVHVPSETTLSVGLLKVLLQLSQIVWKMDMSPACLLNCFPKGETAVFGHLPKRHLFLLIILKEIVDHIFLKPFYQVVPDRKTKATFVKAPPMKASM
jgi:hypothetical protein